MNWRQRIKAIPKRTLDFKEWWATYCTPDLLTDTIDEHTQQLIFRMLLTGMEKVLYKRKRIFKIRALGIATPRNIWAYVKQASFRRR